MAAEESKLPEMSGKAEEVQPYELEPAAPTPPAPMPAAAAPPGKLADKSLIDDMPEDADFTHDPEVEAALKGKKVESKDDTVDEEVKPQPPFVTQGDAKTVALVGAGIAVAAVIAAAVSAETHWFLAAVLAVYFVVIHTITGVAAIGAAAKISDQPLGPIEVAAARMVVAVALFVFLVNLKFSFAHHYIEPLMACAGYWVALAFLMRVPWAKLFYVAAIHAGLACVVWIGMATYAGATAAPVK